MSFKICEWIQPWDPQKIKMQTVYGFKFLKLRIVKRYTLYSNVATKYISVHTVSWEKIIVSEKNIHIS